MRGNPEICLYDGRGSVVQLLQGGTVSQSYSYNAYGYINADEYGIQAPFYGYNGEQHDPSTGLQYLRARYYAPQNGSFTTQDSFAGLLTNALSQNSYTYAQNNPVTFADPSGHSIWDSIKNGLTQAANAVKNTVTSAYNTVMNAITGTTTQKVANTSSAAAKKPYTTTPTPGTFQSSTYSSGAATAAQNARISAVTNSSLLGLLDKSHLSQQPQPFRKDAGPIPVVIQDFAENAEAFIRKGCDESAQWLKTQGEWLWDKASKVPGAMLKLWETAAAINYQEDLMRPQQMLENAQAQNAFAANMWNAIVQMSYENQQNQLQYEQESTKLILKYCVLPELYREKEYFSDKSGVITQGFGGSGTFGIWSFKGSILIAADWRGTIALQTSSGMDGTTGGAGLSANYMFSYIHAPEVKNTEGDAYDIGGSFYKIFGGGGEIIIAPDSEEEGKNYLGIAGQIGYGGGGEVHAGFSTTDTIWSINIYDYLIDLIERVV